MITQSGSVTRSVRASDRVCDVLARGDHLIDVFARRSPHFDKRRNATLRRVMTRLVTVEQAARICGVPPHALVEELNRALGIDARPSSCCWPVRRSCTGATLVQMNARVPHILLPTLGDLAFDCTVDDANAVTIRIRRRA